MKIILGLLFTLTLSASVFAQDSDANYAKTVPGDGVRHSLAKSAKTAVHLFDAMPKFRTYQYTGTRHIYSAAELADFRFYYPRYQSSSEGAELEVSIPTDTDESEMLVSFADLDMMEAIYRQNMKEVEIRNEEMTKKLGIPKIVIPYSDPRLPFLAAHKLVSDSAKKANIDYNPIEKVGIKPVKFANIEDGFIHYSDYDGAYYEGLLQNRYLIKIKLKNVKRLHKCTDVERYIAKYMVAINFAPLNSATKAIAN